MNGSSATWWSARVLGDDHGAHRDTEDVAAGHLVAGEPRATHHQSGSRTGVPSWYSAVWVTSAVSGTDHALTDEGMTVGRGAHLGRYVAVCGAHVTAAPLVAQSGPRCHRCLARLRAWPDATGKPTRAQSALRRAGLLRRWWARRPEIPAVAAPRPPAVPERSGRFRTTAGPGIAPQSPGPAVAHHRRR